jgi:hypothetical protein
MSLQELKLILNSNLNCKLKIENKIEETVVGPATGFRSSPHGFLAHAMLQRASRLVVHGVLFGVERYKTNWDGGAVRVP